ncbi:MAG TPA: hypothetical protein VFQ43_02205 [Nitrososphaera sp.]|nr:hypothetical protein [Nitrososphaera sp.]
MNNRRLCVVHEEFEDRPHLFYLPADRIEAVQFVADGKKRARRERIPNPIWCASRKWFSAFLTETPVL